MSGALSGLSAFGAIAKAVSAAVAFFQGLITRKDQIELGQERQRDVDQQSVIDAERRMEDAGAQPHDDKTTSDSLRRGGF